MGGVYGSKDLQEIAADLGKVVVVGYQVVKGDFLKLLDLLAVINDVKDVDFAKAKEEILELDTDDQADVLGAFNAVVSTIADPTFAPKAEAVLDCLGKGYDLVEEAIGLFAEVKTLLGGV